MLRLDLEADEGSWPDPRDSFPEFPAAVNIPTPVQSQKRWRFLMQFRRTEEPLRPEDVVFDARTSLVSGVRAQTRVSPQVAAQPGKVNAGEPAVEVTPEPLVTGVGLASPRVGGSVPPEL